VVTSLCLDAEDSIPGNVRSFPPAQNDSYGPCSLLSRISYPQLVEHSLYVKLTTNIHPVSRCKLSEVSLCFYDVMLRTEEATFTFIYQFHVVCLRTMIHQSVTKWRRGRFSPSTSVSPAIHCTKFSILTITQGRYNRPVSGRRAEWT
jgi:hypothetical protein